MQFIVHYHHKSGVGGKELNVMDHNFFKIQYIITINTKCACETVFFIFLFFFIQDRNSTIV